MAERSAVSQRFEELQSRLTALSQEREEVQEELRVKQEVETQLQRRTEQLENEVCGYQFFIQTLHVIPSIRGSIVLPDSRSKR